MSFLNIYLHFENEIGCGSGELILAGSTLQTRGRNSAARGASSESNGGVDSAPKPGYNISKLLYTCANVVTCNNCVED